MTSFFRHTPYETAQEIEVLSRLAYDLREDRKLILTQYGADDEMSLLARIVAGEVAEHPAYEHYLSAKSLANTYQATRDQLRDLLLAQGA